MAVKVFSRRGASFDTIHNEHPLFEKSPMTIPPATPCWPEKYHYLMPIKNKPYGETGGES